MHLIIILCCLKEVSSQEWDCTYTGGHESCVEGTCQHKIRGSFDFSTTDFKRNGTKQTNWYYPLYCPIIFEANSEIRAINDWRDIETMTLNENVNATLETSAIAVDNGIIINRNSHLFINAVFSINCPLVIVQERPMNQPVIICYNCYYLDIHYHYSSINTDYNWFNVSYDYNNCVDVISLKSILSTVQGGTVYSLKEEDFPDIELGLYLLSNKQLIRYCKNSDHVDTHVECSMTKYFYNSNTTSADFSFDYPHCPCIKDNKTTCSLTTHLSKISFGTNNI